MIEQDTVDFSNEAYALERMAEGYLGKLSAETLAELRGFIRSEFESAHGDISPGQKFLTEMLDREIDDRERNPSKGFENAILVFVSEAGEARDRLVGALIEMPAAEWDRAAGIISNWIERGAPDAATYARVLEEVVYERGRISAGDKSPIEVPF